MRLRTTAAAIVLAAGTLVTSPASAAKVDSGCHETTTGYTCFYGPYDVGPEGLMINGTLVAAPEEEGFITDARATLVGSDGDEVSVHKVHLHHAVWVNTKEEDLTCPSSPGDRFFATGKERTRMDLPDGYGYHWAYDHTNYWGMVAHLDGMHGSGQNNVYIRLKMGFTTDPLTTPIRPVWVDVNGSCTGDPTFDVPKSTDETNRFRLSAPLDMPASGDFIGMGGHLHDGGVRLKLKNHSTHERMFVSKAVYNKHDPWFLEKMTSFYDLPGKPVSQGDDLELTAVYRNSRNLQDVMGIMMLALVED
jgi:hypothetical protein